MAATTRISRSGSTGRSRNRSRQVSADAKFVQQFAGVVHALLRPEHGSWLLTYRVYNQTGASQRETVIIGPCQGTGKLTEKQAERFAWDHYLNKVDQVAQQPRALMTVAEFWEKHYKPAALNKLKKTTLDQYFSLYRRWIEPVLGLKRLATLEPGDVERAITRALDGEPNALEAAIRGWKRCAHCGDGGTVGNALDRTLAFCACAAGIEAGYDKGACWPTEETARVHADVKSLLVAACFAVEQPFVADAIGDSEVTDDGETLKIALPAAHFGIREADVRPAAERLGWQRRIVITGGRQFSKPAPAAKPEAAAAPLFKAITQADIDRELELAKRRKPPGIEPIGDWIGGTVQ